MSRRVPLPTPEKTRTWAEQMALEQIGPSKFRSLNGTPFGAYSKVRGQMRPRAFGGHVYAQAVYAASKTVAKGMMIHSVTGYFTMLGLADEPFTYEVSVVRTGKNYSVRNVNVTQEDDPTICFSCICSFKRSEPDFMNVQEEHDVKETYAPLMGDKEPQDLDRNVSHLDWRQVPADASPSITSFFPGVLTSILPIEKLHRDRRYLDRTNLYFFSANTEPSADPDYNLEACAHLFHSDRESIFAIIKSYELADVLEVASSLSHTVVFHVPGEQVSFHDREGRRRWFYQETQSKRISDGRALMEGRIYNRDGVLIATMMQDGAFKLKPMTEGEKVRRERRLNNPPKL
ncbi:acyl-CoA thioesterase II [Verruconis gallopava]|uniref:Acyl-CoA thioesterase II n=1 Tax=Verruconis gallopava TaxID=253628 RepID=A0A0D2AIK2_9PEZI|nr:acyl-CoA thioesterase II [Verruconis gallopava]KIW06380.1 acyl-CoA thioesterase II [Verruconis gallopava]